MHVALGGCLKAPPVSYGVTEDTGGHIAYVLGAALAQARRPETREVTIVTRAFSDPRLDPVHSALHEDVAPRCRILRLRTGNSGYLAKEALEAELPALQDAFLRMLRQGDLPDVIHAHFADAAVLARAAAAEFGIPWLYSSHSLALDKCRAQGGSPDAATARRIEREAAAIRDADAIIASSRDEAECQIPAYDPTAEGRVHRVGPGITAPRCDDLDPARRLIAPFLRDMAKPILLAVARPIAKKNLAALIRAYAGDAALQDRANLVIVAGLRDGLAGGCPEQDRIMAEMFDLIDRHDLWGRVALPRRHTHADVASLYALAARGGVFVNPALHEPFGLTLIEAAQAGVPLVATRNGGAADIVASLGAGALVDPLDPGAIASGIRAMLDDRQGAAHAAARARRIYSWDRWADAVQRIMVGLRDRAPAVRDPRAMLASDIDGTLTGCRDGAARFADWAAGRDAGMVLAVATGRSICEARRVLRLWDLPRPDVMITSVGTEIWRWDDGATLRPCADYARLIGADWRREAIVEALRPLGIARQPGHDQRAFKLSFFGNAADRDRIEQRLMTAGLPARVILSHDRLIDVLPARAGKAAAIRFEAARLGIDPRSCIVAGDSGNDLDMLQDFAQAIIPANASAELDGVTDALRSPLPHADGVLDGLERLGHLHPLMMAAE
ncbi:HAD-IIB family hydrolase [Paracoccus zeaxanthinifaciens]|uniref:HAD-IIB family hydrolase n=1 Tax=Paracoccus zeaxanthinifaciens TaxID=187400 RepID=UPI001FE0ABC1|nr:HAD-IIB family hydrolase [Paracoccus zeaxanthinifaciens]